MKRRVFIIEGLAFLLIGLVFLLNSFSSITGAVVLENVSANVSGLIGLVFVVMGLVMMMGGGLEEEIEKNRKLFVERHYKEYRKYLEKGDFLNVPEELREIYRNDKGIIEGLNKDLRDDYAKKRLYELSEETKEIEDTIAARPKKIYANEAEEALDQRRIYLKRRELISLAKRVYGKDRLDKRREGVVLLDEAKKEVITTIPKHTILDKDLARGIMKAIATGKRQH